MKGVNFYKFSRKEEEIFCHSLALQLDNNMSLSDLHPLAHCLRGR